MQTKQTNDNRTHLTAISRAKILHVYGAFDSVGILFSKGHIPQDADRQFPRKNGPKVSMTDDSLKHGHILRLRAPAPLFTHNSDDDRKEAGRVRSYR